MPRELRPLARALSLRTGEVDGLRAWRPVPGAPRRAGEAGAGGRSDALAVCVGVGTERARASTERVLSALRPDAVLVVGVAGAVSATLRVGDVIAPARVVDARTGAAYVPSWDHQGGTGSGAGCGAGAAAMRRGTLVTVPRFGAPLGADATAVDMETAAIAAACAERGVPWDVRRGVSDAAGEVTPAVAGLLRPDGRADLVAVVRLLGTHPTELVRLVRLGRSTGRGLRAMTEAALDVVTGSGAT